MRVKRKSMAARGGGTTNALQRWLRAVAYLILCVGEAQSPSISASRARAKVHRQFARLHAEPGRAQGGSGEFSRSRAQFGLGRARAQPHSARASSVGSGAITSHISGTVAIESQLFQSHTSSSVIVLVLVRVLVFSYRCCNAGHMGAASRKQSAVVGHAQIAAALLRRPQRGAYHREQAAELGRLYSYPQRSRKLA